MRSPRPAISQPQASHLAAADQAEGPSVDDVAELCHLMQLTDKQLTRIAHLLKGIPHA